MLGAALTPRRKVALALALAWWVPSSAFVFYKLHVDAELPLLQWPFAVTASWTLASAVASGVVVAEAVRFGARSGSSWSDKRHLRVVLLVAVVLLAIQWVSLVLESQRGGIRAF